MNSRKCMQFALLVFAVLGLTGCPIVDSKLLEAAREYFPDCVVTKPRPDVVIVDTKVGHISQKFAKKTFIAMLQSDGQKLSLGLAAAGYRFFMLGFADFIVVWDTNQPQIFWVFDQPQFEEWWRQTFGAPADPSQEQRIEE